MGKKRGYILDRKAENYLEHYMEKIVWRYLQGEITQRDTDAFRGVIDALWNMDFFTIQGYTLLHNFSYFLEGKRNYEEDEDRVHQELCNIYEEQFRERGMFDNEG